MMPDHESISSLTILYQEMLSLSVYRGLQTQPVTGSLLALLECASRRDTDSLCSQWGALCSLLAEQGMLDSLPSAVAAEVLADENRYTAALAAGQPPSPALEKAALRDLEILYRAASLEEECWRCAVDDDLFSRFLFWGRGPAPPPLDHPWEKCCSALLDYHQRRGCGCFVRHNAFLWREGRMLPVEHPDPIGLCGLKGYEQQRQAAVDNTRAFLDGFEANNLLLYGDRGTGKSSTVKALLNEYADDGLRMVEMPKEYLRQLPDLTGRLSALPLKFIVFIDDLSFSEDDDSFASLKAVLEGGLASRPDNVLIYATSNRRHLLRETFSDRKGDEIHCADTVQEAASLSDRFGICLTFLMPDRQRFLDMVAQLASDRDLKVDQSRLFAAAERWALERGARSPRYAKQFITDAEARLSRGESL